MSDEIQPRVPDQVLSAEEVKLLGGDGTVSSKALMQFVQNPGALANLFSLTDNQANNVRAVISGMGTAASVRYLSKAFGTEISAIIGAAVSAFIAGKAFGR